MSEKISLDSSVVCFIFNALTFPNGGACDSWRPEAAGVIQLSVRKIVPSPWWMIWIAWVALGTICTLQP